MEAGTFEYWRMPKKFHDNVQLNPINAYSLATVRTSSKLQQVEKMRRKSKDKSKMASLFEKYLSKPNAVIGKPLTDENALKRMNKKFRTTFTCSQSSLQSMKRSSDQMETGSVDKRVYLPSGNSYEFGENNTMSAGFPDLIGKAHSLDTEFPGNSFKRSVSMYKSKPSHQILVKDPHEVNSDRPEFIPGFNDDYFDFLNLPGHFNTRGIFGQKANVVVNNLSRSNTDLGLSFLGKDYVNNRRQNTFILPNVSRKEDTMLPKKKLSTVVLLPKLTKYNRITNTSNVKTTREGLVIDKKKDINTAQETQRFSEIPKNPPSSVVSQGFENKDVPHEQNGRFIDVFIQTDPYSDDDDESFDFM
ncbi:hypothetical protein DPMN_022752 [Dreissena polymorpha]|uniref:Uncharacterized protein n=1 Tax=Dreissena polymorpha TaxID=45954 RepID=A0A9D4NKV9_DREPO|nr:hypothetical protein DPMN_022752 [Dreissena polymorpha]